MQQKSVSDAVGYTRREFNALFQVYSREVYTGFFKDFSFGEADGKYLMAFREQAGKTPLLTIEKRVLGPERVLFSARSPEGREVARSEKLESFVNQMRAFIDRVKLERETGTDKKIGYMK